MDKWNHFLTDNLEINIEQTGEFETKYAEGSFNVEAGSIYIQIDGYHHFNAYIDNSVFVAVVEIKGKNIQKLFELELFPSDSFEKFDIVKNQTFIELNSCLERIQLQKNLDENLSHNHDKKSMKKI